MNLSKVIILQLSLLCVTSSACDYEATVLIQDFHCKPSNKNSSSHTVDISLLLSITEEITTKENSRLVTIKHGLRTLSGVFYTINKAECSHETEIVFMQYFNKNSLSDEKLINDYDRVVTSYTRSKTERSFFNTLQNYRSPKTLNFTFKKDVECLTTIPMFTDIKLEYQDNDKQDKDMPFVLRVMFLDPKPNNLPLRIKKNKSLGPLSFNDDVSVKQIELSDDIKVYSVNFLVIAVLKDQIKDEKGFKRIVFSSQEANEKGLITNNLNPHQLENELTDLIQRYETIKKYQSRPNYEENGPDLDQRIENMDISKISKSEKPNYYWTYQDAFDRLIAELQSSHKIAKFYKWYKKSNVLQDYDGSEDPRRPQKDLISDFSKKKLERQITGADSFMRSDSNSADIHTQIMERIRI